MSAWRARRTAPLSTCCRSRVRAFLADLRTVQQMAEQVPTQTPMETMHQQQVEAKRAPSSSGFHCLIAAHKTYFNPATEADVPTR